MKQKMCRKRFGRVRPGAPNLLDKFVFVMRQPLARVARAGFKTPISLVRDANRENESL